MISFDFSRFIKNCPGTCYFQGKNNCFSTIIDKNKVYGIIVKYHIKRLKIPFCLSLDLPIFCHFLWILFAVIIRSHQNFAQTYKFKVFYGVFLNTAGDVKASVMMISFFLTKRCIKVESNFMHVLSLKFLI